MRADVRLEGLLGAALAASQRGRLFHFITDPASPAIALFDPQRVAGNVEGDWYGEHAGKWLVAAARSAARTNDAQLAANVQRVADHLVGLQDSDGYLGTYAPARRFMVKQAPKAKTWDGAPSVRTWDIWTHSYLLLGLLEVHRHFPAPRYIEAARRIGDLCWHTLSGSGIAITELGNHFGLSATVLMDPAMELHFATGDPRYLELALLVLRQADADPDLALLSRALAGTDAAEIATGKAYQLGWNLVGLAKIHKATGDAQHRQAVESLWLTIREHHLTLGGGPWGGVAHRSREVFNAPGSFSPLAYVETCSTLAWIQLNRELLAISGEAKYADEIERSAYNDMLGAMAPNGEDWCYYSFPNGRRVHTTYWRCCKSSGAMALEELPAIACTVSDDDLVSVNLYGPGEARFELPQAGSVRLRQTTAYPFDGAIAIEVEPERPAAFAISLRIPAWARGASLQVNERVLPVRPGGFATLDRTWQRGDRIGLNFPMAPRIERRELRNVQVSRAPDGQPVQQEVMHHDYLAVMRGPLVYATGLIDGFKTEETIRVPADQSDQWLEVLPASPGRDGEGPAIRMRLADRAPLLFEPYYRTGGRADGAWRLTWLSLAPPRQTPSSSKDS